MKLPLNADVLHEPLNGAGTPGDGIGEILHGLKPMAVYFAERDARFGAMRRTEAESPSDVPRFAESLFVKSTPAAGSPS